MTVDHVVAGDGTEIAVARWGDGPPVIVAAHATGFCKEVWAPTVVELDRLGFGGTVIALDQRGHGESGPFAGSADWWRLGEDLVSVAGDLTSPPDLGLGHSSGGAAVALADLISPGLFPRLALVEPIVFPPGYGDAEELARAATRRRRRFASPADALEHFAGKEVFAAWERRALEAYVGGCLHERDGAWWLDCAPDAEADAYAAAARHGAWPRLGEISVPVLLMAGEASTTHHAQFARRQAAQFADATLEIVPGAGHFLPMEQPAYLARRILRWLAA